MFLVCHQIKGGWIKPGAAVIDVGHIVSAAAEQDVMVCAHMQQLPQQNPHSFGANHLPVLTDY
jgi:5,10-methylene-tetrahydrofolate dehydrogenase/methenyl tetrahydrofolate cyclohydrolase